MASPGPATLGLAAVGAGYGARRGLRYYFGIVAGTTGVLLLIATGITGLILAQPALLGLVSLVAAVYILYLAFKIATAPVLSANAGDVRAPSFLSGFGLAIANPKAFAAIGAAYASHRLVEEPLWLDTLLKIGAFLPAVILVNLGWLYFGAALSGLLTDARAARAVNIVFAVLLLLSLALIFFDRPALF